MNDILWEIMVPASNHSGQFPYEHHKRWDEFVLTQAGGLTIFRGAKGKWISSYGRLFKDRMIPVRIACNREAIDRIMQFTLEHYKQEAVFCYAVSETVLIKYADTKKEDTP